MTMTISASVDGSTSRVEARTAQGAAIRMDSDASEGAGRAAEPKETLLAALAGCTGMDVASILRKKRQAVETYEIVVEGASGPDHPRVFTRIEVEHRVRGNVTAEALRRSIELSATQYCPVNAMLSQSVTIEHRYRLDLGNGRETSAVVAVTGPDGARVV